MTVSSRIVGLIGNSNNPISGMTIATVMSTCLIFLAVGWGGKAYEAMALVVGGMVCIAAANAGATSQDLKTGYLVGSTPKYQQAGVIYRRHRLCHRDRFYGKDAGYTEFGARRERHPPRHRQHV
ncbi:OPT/YSL family transporter [Puia sp. P3]|uniref:OPT/YSL family transporter n=1 Tax=Puia sp. P3 TaxID=3423952 RepID=UPI003D66D62E